MYHIKAAFAKNLLRKILFLKVFDLSLICIFETNTSFFKNISFGRQLKWGINIYLSIFIEQMLKDMYCVPYENSPKNMFQLFFVHLHEFWRLKTQKFIATCNAALLCQFPYAPPLTRNWLILFLAHKCYFH